MLLLVWFYFQYQYSKMYCFLFNVSGTEVVEATQSASQLISVTTNCRKKRYEVQQHSEETPALPWGRRCVSHAESLTQYWYDYIKSVVAEKSCGREAAKDEEEWLSYNIKKIKKNHSPASHLKNCSRRWRYESFRVEVTCHGWVLICILLIIIIITKKHNKRMTCSYTVINVYKSR